MEMAMATLTGIFLQGLVNMYHPMYYNPMLIFSIQGADLRSALVDLDAVGTAVEVQSIADCQERITRGVITWGRDITRSC